MLSALIFSINGVGPIIIIIALGYIAVRLKWVNDSFTDAATKVVFNLALPVYLFSEITSADAGSLLDGKLNIFVACGVVTSFLILTLVVPLFVKSRPVRGAFIQGVYRSNIAILGVPLAQNLYGDAGAQSMALLILITIPLYNVLAVVILSVNSDEAHRSSGGKLVLNIIKGVVTNPLIIGIALALICLAAGVRLSALPKVLSGSVSLVAGMSTPLALFCLGSGLKFRRFGERIRYSLTAAALRLLAMPVLACGVGYAAGFRHMELVLILIAFGTPTAVSSYIMAKNMGSDYDLAGEIVLLTTVGSTVTLFLFTFVFRAMGIA